MLAFNSKERIPSVSLFNALKEIMNDMEFAAQIALKHKLINSKQFDEYLAWIGKDKLIISSFDNITQEET